MAGSGFVSADTSKIAKFETDSAAIKEFDAIKKEFNTINSTLLSKWKYWAQTLIEKRPTIFLRI